MQLVCYVCGEKFDFTEKDIEFYKKQGWNTLPKKCRKCRKMDIKPENGLKRSSFFENALTYGAPFNVEGGTTVGYTYEIRIKIKDSTKYVVYYPKERAFHLTESREKASHFLKEDSEMIVEEYKRICEADTEIKCIAYGHYETLRE